MTLDYKLNSPTSALAVGKINDDRFADVVQGDAGANAGAGELRVWLGRDSGLPGEAETITQDTGRVQGIEDRETNSGAPSRLASSPGTAWPTS